MQQMRAEKLRQERRRRFMLRVLLPAGIIILLAAVIFATARSGGKASSAKAEASTAVEAATVTQATDAATAAAAATSQAAVPFSAQKTDSTKDPGVGVGSKYALLIDLATGNILYDRDAETRINPASMTKVLTCLVAVENIKDLDATYKITNEDTDFSYVNGCSQVGFEPGETVTVKDLLYGLILSSGGDAASAIANYTAGSMDDFVTLMNSKLEELGLSGSAHFTNDAGIYDADHYCTAYDMAMIMEAALQNETCREVMSAHVYTTTKTTEHPDGLTISNWFLRRIEDKDCGGTVVCAKTGYVEQSGSCAVSYATGADGKEYLAVTADASSGWRAIYDHVALYKMMFEPDSTIEPATTENASESDTVPADSEGGSSSDGSSAGAGNEGN
jgi:D-alanyl-D-alanine carboxypeptidase (penicillin-binding protein 5/6)